MVTASVCDEIAEDVLISECREVAESSLALAVQQREMEE